MSLFARVDTITLQLDGGVGVNRVSQYALSKLFQQMLLECVFIVPSLIKTHLYFSLFRYPDWASLMIRQHSCKCLQFVTEIWDLGYLYYHYSTDMNLFCATNKISTALKKCSWFFCLVVRHLICVKTCVKSCPHLVIKVVLYNILVIRGTKYLWPYLATSHLFPFNNYKTFRNDPPALFHYLAIHLVL